MQSFRRLRATAAAIPIANVDTDMLAPAAFLKTVSRNGLDKALFHAARVDAEGRERRDFILNRDPWRGAGILVTLDNFGCGSSREHAVWALLEFGVSCIIATGFADIFHANCFKNGILPIVLDPQLIEVLMADASKADTATLAVDLEEQAIARGNGEQLSFRIDPRGRRRLLDGLDDITLSLQHDDAIRDHERAKPALSAMPLQL